jgi:fatty acid amide hydrolase 2
VSVTIAPATPLTERSATGLAAAIKAGEVTSREVVEAHIELLQRTGDRLNAIACDRFEAARRDADAADARLRDEGPDALPRFHGVPCTIKESIALVGMPNCAGLVARRDHRATRTAPAAQRLIDAGAIPLGVTNTSEMTMWLESENHVYGRTNNAYDRRRTAGGSSGGEGAAVGSGGSPIGLGSDIGGSIRLPAFFNGVFGHKPTPGLVPNTGQWPTTSGESGRLLTLGPLARRAEDLMPFLDVVAGPDGEDPLAAEIPLGDPADVALDGLDVLVSDDADFRPVKGELRDARERAAGALVHAGANVRTVSLKPMRRAFELYLAALADGSEEWVTEIIAAETGGPLKLREAFRRDGDHTRALAIHLVTEKLAPLMPAWQRRRALAAGESLRREVNAALGDGVLLYRPFGRVAPRHGRTVGRAWVLTAPAAFNLLGLPVTQVPLGIGREGVPVGVQVAARPGHDHVAIRVALELERAFGGWVAPGF